jgi:hypothetical protein
VTNWFAVVADRSPDTKIVAAPAALSTMIVALSTATVYSFDAVA